MADTLIPDWLRQQARLRPNAVALETSGDQAERFTFRQLDASVDETAAWLAARGVMAGTHLGLLAANTPAFAAVVYACLRLGAVLVPLNTRLTPAEVAWQIEDAGVEHLLFDPTTADAAALLAGHGWTGTSHHLEWRHGKEVSATVGEARLDLDRAACIVYTSGTTGTPKGAVLTVGNLWWSAVGSALNLGLLPEDAWLACLPLFHVGGLSILVKGAIYGMRVVLHTRFDPEAANAAIEQQHVTMVSVVAAMLQRMLDTRGEEPYPGWLRCLLLGGGPAPRDLLDRCAALGAPVVQTYGLTETASQVVTLSPSDALLKLGSAGQPLLPNEIHIETEHGSATPGESGEILVRGPTVMAGYYQRPEATTEKLRDGWLHTGDLGYLDQDGYLYVLDRRDDLVISGGENVYPAEIEAALRQHPAVLDAGVRGLPDAHWGQVPVAWIVARTGAAPSEDEFAAFLRPRLAAYKLPRAYHVVAELPRNAAGKLLRRELR